MSAEYYDNADDAVILEKRILISFNEKLKKHLSEEMMYFTEKKNDLENRILQLKMESEKRDKTLFQNMEKIDVRKYFSPLNLSEMEQNKKDESKKELSGEMQRLHQSIEQIDARLNNVRDILHEMDEIIENAD